MFISTESEQIQLGPDCGEGSLIFSSMGSNPDSSDALPADSAIPDSPSLPTIYTDINVVPEQEKGELEKLISDLEGEVEQLRLKGRSLDEKRREALNQILDIKGSIRVFCRVRPFLTKERRRMLEPVSTGLDTVVVKSSGSKKGFRFDKVFNPAANQEDIFAEVEPILRSALDGHNVCIFAYGQTGTGKTFSMDGTNDQQGIVPRALEELFRQASSDNPSSISFSMSMLEVYMGNIKDLLAPKQSLRANGTVARCNLNIQTDPKGYVDIEGLTVVQIPDFARARWWHARGKRFRSTSWTNVNEASSRSHCLTRVIISRHQNPMEAKAEVSKLWMIDLGGSERLLKTGATGQTLDEGRAINLSLSALGDVIAALRTKKGHVPYRNSKLTQILKDSLGNDSKVLMLVHVSPSEEDVNETICSLSFAKRARAVESSREIPEDLKKLKEKRIAELEQDMREAEEGYQKVRDQIRKIEFLLQENRKLYSTSYEVHENDENLKGTEQVVKEEVIETPRTCENATKRHVPGSVPRFMTSTVASRQRQSDVVIAKARSFRLGTRNLVQFSGSQSLGFSDPRLRVMLRNANQKAQNGETNAALRDGPKCNGLDLKTTSLPRNKIVMSSDPNIGATLGHHRRRMSALI